MSHVVLRLGGGRFALPMADVAEVGRVSTITRVPGTPSWVTGACNWRGRILGVLDVRLLLGVSTDDSDAEATRLVVLSRAGVTVGVVAEKVEGVIDVEPDSLEPPLLTLTDEAGSLLEGQLTDAEGPVGVIDIAALFALRHRLGAVRRAG